MSSTPNTEPSGAGGVSNPIRRLAGLFEKLTALMNSAGTLWVFFLVFLICADIFARWAFNAPIRGTTEIVGYTIVGAVFLQLAHCLHRGPPAAGVEWVARVRGSRPAARSGRSFCGRS